MALPVNSNGSNNPSSDEIPLTQAGKARMDSYLKDIDKVSFMAIVHALAKVYSKPFAESGRNAFIAEQRHQQAFIAEQERQQRAFIAEEERQQLASLAEYAQQFQTNHQILGSRIPLTEVDDRSDSDGSGVIERSERLAQQK